MSDSPVCAGHDLNYACRPMNPSNLRRLPQVAALAAALLSAYPVLAQSTYVFRGPMKGLVVSTGLPAAGLSGSSLAFGAVDVGQSAAPRSVTLTNVGDVVMNLSGAPQVSGSGFSLQSTTCGSTLAPAASCTVSVGFAPVADGVASGSLSFATDAAGSPHVVSLSGSGLTYPGASLSTSLMAFGAVNVGAGSNLSVRLTNTGTAPLQLTSAPALSGDAAFSFPAGAGTSCGSSLAVNAFCDTTVRFSPAQTASVTGTLSFSTNAAGSPLEVSLTGSGLQALGALAAASGSSSNFGAVSVGGQATQNFVFSNTGNASATGVAASVSGTDLSLVSNNCGTQASPVTVAAGGTCTVSVRYSPNAAGTLTGTLSVASSATNSPSSLSLSGSAAFSGRTVMVSPAVSGQTYWNLDSQPLVLSTTGSYTVTPMSNFTMTVKAWGGGGQGGGAGGYAGGTLSASQGTNYIASLPDKGGLGGSNPSRGWTGAHGGAYAGLFVSSVSAGNTLVMAGGGGGGSTAGFAGGLVGANGVNSTNCSGVTMYGRGGTQSAGGAGGTPFDGHTVNPGAGSWGTGGSGGSVNNYNWGPGPGGGAGYYGGGGGSGGGSCTGSAGGASSFVSGTLSSTSNVSATGSAPGNSADADRGTGGNSGTLVGRIVLR